MKTLLLLSALLVLSSGSSCLDSQTVLPGQLNEITDATTVSCRPYKTTDTDHQCLLLTNPVQNTVKVFDITDNQFVLSPIAYFPLIIKVGSYPGQIATIKDRVFTLDPVDKKIYEIPSSFASPLNNSLESLDFSANHFALTTDAEEKIIAFVSQTNNKITSITEIALEGQALTNPVSLPAQVDHFQINPSQTYLLIASGQQFYVINLKTQTPLSPVLLPALTSVLSISSDSTRALLSLSNKTLVVVDLEKNTIEATSPTLSANATKVYLPSSLPGTPSTCCNGKANWVGALLTDNTLQYWPYSNQTFGETPQIIDIVATTGVGSFTLTNPIKLVGAQVQNQNQDGLSCERRLFLIYSGAIFNTCEGNSNIKRVDQMEN